MSDPSSVKSCLQTLSSGDFSKINAQQILDQCKQLNKLSQNDPLSPELVDAFAGVGVAFAKVWDLKDANKIDINKQDSVATQVFSELTRIVINLSEHSSRLASAMFSAGVVNCVSLDLGAWSTGFESKLRDENTPVLKFTLQFLRIIALIARFEELNYQVSLQTRGLNLPAVVKLFLKNG